MTSKEVPKEEFGGQVTSKTIAESELGSSSLSKAKETVKGTIFDDKVGFKTHPKRPNVRQELVGIIDDLEAENTFLQSQGVLAILERLKELKKHL